MCHLPVLKAANPRPECQLVVTTAVSPNLTASHPLLVSSLCARLVSQLFAAAAGAAGGAGGGGGGGCFKLAYKVTGLI